METKYFDIIYEIEFFSNWHCGSGLAAGADVDALVVKDKDGLPYVPGRTLKGLLREAACDLFIDENNKKIINEMFGISGDETGHQVGNSFFGNATFTDNEHKGIVKNDWTEHLFQTFASTAIDENGIADENTLRKIETVIPCKLQGKILHVPDTSINLLENSMQFIKRMGTGRNRGYGRCKISITGKETSK